MQDVRRWPSNWIPLATLIAVLLQLLGFVYAYGKLNQHVEDTAGRLDRIEQRLDQHIGK